MSSLVGLADRGVAGLEERGGVAGEGDLAASGDPAAIDGDGGTVHGVSQSIFFTPFSGAHLRKKRSLNAGSAFLR